MTSSRKYQSFLAKSSKKYFKIGLGTSLLMVIAAFHVPIYSNTPQVPLVTEEEVFIIDYYTEYVPEKKVEKKVEQKITPKALPTIPAPEPIEPRNVDPEPILPITPISSLPTIIEPVKVVEPKTYDFVEKMPTYRGGESAMLAYFAKEAEYNQYAVNEGIEGKVHVRFVINENGEIIEVEIAKGVHPLLDAEALRVVKAMPNWEPGVQNGKKVRVSMVVPVSFVLK